MPPQLCTYMQAFILVRCQGLCRSLSVLVALPMAHALQVLWRSFLSLPPSLSCHVTCHQSHFCLLVCLLAPCICFCSFLFFAVSLRPGDGLPSPPHNTVGCAKVMMNHIPPTRCLKTKINTNADFHTPNHAVQHGAGFTNLMRILLFSVL